MTAAPDDDIDALGLNLVFSAPPAVGADAGKKPKRRTKYDRRRERGRQAKLGKEREQEERPRGEDWRRGEPQQQPLTGQTKQEDAVQVGHAAGVAAALGDTIAGDPSATAGTGSRPRGPGGDGTATQPTPSPPGDDNGTRGNAARAERGLAAIPRPSSAVTVGAAAPSRKRRTPTMSATEEEERARYLSEFHSRPRDLDRDEGAARDIKASTASDHIFGDDIAVGDGGEEEEEEATGEANVPETRSEEKATCPFQKLGLHPRLVATLTSQDGKFRLRQPTIIQSRSIGALLPRSNKKKKSNKNGIKEQNLFVQSETGSGKTLAYLLPVLQHLAVDSATGSPKRVDRQLGGTRALILCPTRELATQTQAVAECLCRAFAWIVPGCLSGGEKRKSEKSRLRKGITVLIATPGRLLDHLSKTESLLTALRNKLEWLVLDEADRLLDAGLGGQVEQIAQKLRSNQPKAGPRKDGVTWRSVLVSATVSKDLQGLAKTALGGVGWAWARGHRDAAVMREVGEQSKPSENDDDDEAQSADQAGGKSNELDNAAPRQLAQLYMVVSAKLRLSSLVAFLSARAAARERTVVFMSTCDGVDYHHALFGAMECILDDGNNDQDIGKDTDKGERGGGIFGKDCPVYKLHGDVPHALRRSILASFNGSKSAILLATDVAARGLNFPSLDWTVQYDPPCETKDYVHRAGRSARAGDAGHSLLFLLPSERQYVEVLNLRGLKEISALSLSATLGAAARTCGGVAREGDARAAGNKFSDARGEAFTTAIQDRLEQRVIQDDADYKSAIAKKSKGDPKHKRERQRRRKEGSAGPLLEGARKAYAAFVRAYPAKEKAVRHVFNARGLHLGHVARSLALREAPGKLARGRDANGGSVRGEKRKSGLAFGNGGDTSREEGGINDEGAANAIKDGERERDLGLLDNAISAGGRNSDRRRALTSKKARSSANEGNVQKRMMEAAMKMQGQEFM